MRLVWLALIGVSEPALAQRPLCTELPAVDRDRARGAGLCRDPAPIIDVAPKVDTAPAIAPTAPPGAGSFAVPDVIGLSFDDARGRLTRFTLQRSYRAAAEPGGTVLAQAPMSPATLVAGAPVSLVLSDGSLVRVPRVTSININEARQRLQKELDLKPQPVVVTSELRVGTVIEQEPAEGTLVKRGSVVRLQVSAGQEGPEQIDVPSVVGLTFDRAKARLARFTVERVERPRNQVPNQPPLGQVIEQAPGAASRAAAGSVVVLTVAGAPRTAVEIFEMPNVVGRSFADAVRSLAEFKVGRSEVDNVAPRDQIVAQTPTAGSTLMPGDAVALQVSAGPLVTVPSAAVKTEAASTKPAKSNASDVPKATGGRDVLAGMLGISAAVVLGLIVGALVMRQMLSRRRAITAADAAADDAITSMVPPPPMTSVDILLEEQPNTPPSAQSNLDEAAASPSEPRNERDEDKNPRP